MAVICHEFEFCALTLETVVPWLSVALFVAFASVPIVMPSSWWSWPLDWNWLFSQCCHELMMCPLRHFWLAACVTHVVVYSLYCSLVIGLICQVECPFAVRISTCHGYQLLVRLLPLDHLGCRVDRWGHA